MALGLNQVTNKKKKLPRHIVMDETASAESVEHETEVLSRGEGYRPWSEHVDAGPAPAAGVSESPRYIEEGLYTPAGPLERARMAVSRAHSIVEKNDQMIEQLKSRRIVKDFKAEEEPKIWSEEDDLLYRPSEFGIDPPKRVEKQDGLVKKIHRFLMN